MLGGFGSQEQSIIFSILFVNSAVKDAPVVNNGQPGEWLARAGEPLHLSPWTIRGQPSPREDYPGTALSTRVGYNLELPETGRLILIAETDDSALMTIRLMNHKFVCMRAHRRPEMEPAAAGTRLSTMENTGRYGDGALMSSIDLEYHPLVRIGPLAVQHLDIFRG